MRPCIHNAWRGDERAGNGVRHVRGNSGVLSWMIDFSALALPSAMFFGAFALDIVWALYIQRVAERKKISAAMYSTLTGALSTIWVFGIQKDLINSIFWLAGLFA